MLHGHIMPATEPDEALEQGVSQYQQDPLHLCSLLDYGRLTIEVTILVAKHIEFQIMVAYH